MSQNTTHPARRPVGVAHLIFGLIFTGLAAMWLIGEASGTDVPDLALGFPAVLIGAGVVGLVAILVNQRRARTELVPAAATRALSDDTTILHTEKDES
ncbi:MAG: hypothetical protein NTV23_12380 [Propionibacteriales bacterium]|nr:hypothetical protein [Propionibacteriales bacterium]